MGVLFSVGYTSFQAGQQDLSQNGTVNGVWLLGLYDLSLKVAFAEGGCSGLADECVDVRQGSQYSFRTGILKEVPDLICQRGAKSINTAALKTDAIALGSKIV